MARKCNTEKYRRRRAKERKNRKEKVVRLRIAENERHESWEELQKLRRAERLTDPRHQAVQRLVNVLYARLRASPLYGILQISQISRFLEKETGIPPWLIRGSNNGR